MVTEETLLTDVLPLKLNDIWITVNEGRLEIYPLLGGERGPHSVDIGPVAPIR